MKKHRFNELVQSVQDMQAIRAGKMKPARVTKLTPDHPLAVRTRLGMTQEQFSEMLGVPLGTLRGWEYNRRKPGGAAKALLRVAAKHPTIVRAALAAA